MTQRHAGRVGGGDHGVDARQRAGGPRVDAHDPRVDSIAAEDLPHQHSRQLDVMNIARLAGHLRRGVELRDTLADQALFLDEGRHGRTSESEFDVGGVHRVDGRRDDRVDDLPVARAATQIAFEAALDLLGVRPGRSA